MCRQWIFPKAIQCMALECLIPCSLWLPSLQMFLWCESIKPLERAIIYIAKTNCPIVQWVFTYVNIHDRRNQVSWLRLWSLFWDLLKGAVTCFQCFWKSVLYLLLFSLLIPVLFIYLSTYLFYWGTIHIT